MPRLTEPMPAYQSRESGWFNKGFPAIGSLVRKGLGLGLTIAPCSPLLTFLRINEGPGEVAEWPKAPVC